jgi:hypothetical protein
MRRFGALLAMSVLLVATGCGGSGRPSVNEVSKALQKGGKDSILGAASSKIGDKAANCVAQTLVDSKLSDEALQAIVDGEKNFKPTKADTTAASAVSAKMVKCVSTGLK